MKAKVSIENFIEKFYSWEAYRYTQHISATLRRFMPSSAGALPPDGLGTPQKQHDGYDSSPEVYFRPPEPSEEPHGAPFSSAPVARGRDVVAHGLRCGNGCCFPSDLAEENAGWCLRGGGATVGAGVQGPGKARQPPACADALA